MRLLLWLLLAVSVSPAAEVPAGTSFTVRLVDGVSSATARPGAPVQAVTVAPVMVGGKVLIPPHTVLTGKVKAAVSALKSPEQQGALHLEFTGIELGGKAVAAHAVVAAVDNARETVDDRGIIHGIVPSATLEGLAERGIHKLGQNPQYSPLSEILLAAKEALVKPVDPEITYGPGVEMTLRLTKEANLKAPAEYRPPAGFPKPEELTAMVEQLPFTTFAANPPQPSDVTNLLFIGTEQQVTAAFEEAGWNPAHQLNEASKFETAIALIESRGYKEAPVSLLLLDNQPPAFVFQKNNNTFAQRHHLRIWRMPGDFDGIPVWQAAASHDTGIDFSQDTFTFIHRVDSNIDAERAKVVDDLVFTGHVAALEMVDRPRVPHSFRNATGDAIATDGRIAILRLQ